jgi:protein-S-isoprenylcysteine O-methyltransferase Ste14
MTHGRSGSFPAHAQGDRWLTAAAFVAAGAAFFGLWLWLFSRWLGFRTETAGMVNWRWLAALPSVLGFSIALRCVWDFGRTGRGTPAPFAPPQRLVAVGFYRHVRNPMYVGAAAGWIGLWVILGHATPAAIAVVVAAALGVHLFVLLYEEPTLRAKFGPDYQEYCRKVNRWWPRVRGWNKPQ